MIYAIANQKGGVGKTTTTVNLAACLADTGARVLLVDLDPQANASSGLGFRGRGGTTIADVILDGAPVRDAIRATKIPNLDIVTSDPDLSSAAIELPGREARERILANALTGIRGDYGFVFIDCPPSLDLLAVNALTAADRLIIDSPTATGLIVMKALAPEPGLMAQAQATLAASSCKVQVEQPAKQAEAPQPGSGAFRPSRR